MSITLSTLMSRLATMIGDSNSIYADKYMDAICNSARESYPTLFRPLIDETLITGNILPPFIWTATGTDTSTLALYSLSNVTLTKTTTGGLFRNGLTSAKAKASAANGYLMLSSDNYPRLLDFMGNEADYKAWTYPLSAADDGFLTIYTVKADGTAQTLNSTTTCPQSKFTLLELEDQDINDDIVLIQFRMRVLTNGQYVYFDPPRALGLSVQDYILPEDFQNGEVNQVWTQSSSYSEDACDDLHPSYREEFGWTINNDGSYKYLHFPYAPSAGRKIKLIGNCPLESDLSASTSTMTIDETHAPLLLSYAAYLLYEMQRGIVSGDAADRYDVECNRWLMKTEMLKRKLKMGRMVGQIHWT
ncbi:MAG: hypothetical protein MUP81_02230 [Dehalococcoidia bacterium]|nr:hypothetical protein [Dehalococcoidia bacterium]